jgi:hypothetical protein
MALPAFARSLASQDLHDYQDLHDFRAKPIEPVGGSYFISCSGLSVCFGTNMP